MYQEKYQPIVEGNGYAVYELEQPNGGRKFTLWGPDINGRFCRNGAYFDLHSAMASFRVLSKSA